jgi:hypothetical protein
VIVADTSTDLEERRFAISLFPDQFSTEPLMATPRYKSIVKCFGRSEERTEKGGEAFSPVLYAEPRRGNQYVECVTLALVDYDDGTTIAEAKERFSAFEFLLYTSFNHTPEHHRFRLLFPLEKSIAAKDWDCAWAHLAKLAPGLDESCKDLARIYYLPTHRPGAEQISFRNEGMLLDLPTTPPVETRRQQPKGWSRMKVGRGGAIEKARWSDRTFSGPAPTLESWLDRQGVGWSARDGGGRRLLILDECPWASEHSSASKPRDTAVFVGTDGKWCFKCLHAHCAGRGWRDFRSRVERPG